MYAVANARCSILRGTTLDAYGDEVDAATVVASNVPALIEETNANFYDPSTQTPRVIRVVGCHLQSDTDVLPGDRLRDDTHGVIYMIESVTQPGGPGLVTDLELNLRRVT